MAKPNFVIETSARRDGPWQRAFPDSEWAKAKQAYEPAYRFWRSEAAAGLWVRVVRKGAERAVHKWNPFAGNVA